MNCSKSYFDFNKRLCVACDNSCQNCINGTKYDCITCRNDSYLSGTYIGQCLSIQIPIPTNFWSKLGYYNNKLGYLSANQHIVSWILTFLTPIILLFIGGAMIMHIKKLKNYDRLDLIEELGVSFIHYEIVILMNEINRKRYQKMILMIS